MLEIEIVVAHTAEYPALVEFYQTMGYRAGIALTDRVYVAKLQGQPIGLVRRTDEGGVLMLRGMQVAPSVQHSRVGSRLLAALVAELPSRECYCIPFSHLTGFYGQGGFEPLTEVAAPVFLRERLAQYRAAGHDVLLMRRPAIPDHARGGP